MEDSVYDKSKPNDNSSKNDAHKGVSHFEYYQKSIVVDGKPYNVVINIRVKSDGRYVYDVRFNPNKKRPSAGPSLTDIVKAPPVRTKAVAGLGNNIPHPTSDVKRSLGRPTTNQIHVADLRAGEIEARDTSGRRSLTSEQRKNTRPDIDREDVVFAEGAQLSNSLAGYNVHGDEVYETSDYVKGLTQKRAPRPLLGDV